MTDRALVQEFTLAPATGRAVPVLRGQVLRIEQIADGQCLDLNLYNLHDYKEHFHSGRTRGLHGLHPKVGDHLWSAPPRERAMATIVADTVGTNDLTYSRCSAFLYEAHYGFSDPTAHSNCHDAFAEAIREWDLTPDDVHDSFNGFMNTKIVNGRLAIDRMVARAGDHLEFLAQMDLLAVPVCCGGDLGATNNYELKGLRVAVFAGAEKDEAPLLEARFTHQRGPESFRNAKIRTERALHRNPAYQAEWPWREKVGERYEIPVELDEASTRLLRKVRALPRFADMSEAELLRFIFFQWLERYHRKPIAKALSDHAARQPD